MKNELNLYHHLWYTSEQGWYGTQNSQFGLYFVIQVMVQFIFGTASKKKCKKRKLQEKMCFLILASERQGFHILANARKLTDAAAWRLIDRYMVQSSCPYYNLQSAKPCSESHDLSYCLIKTHPLTSAITTNCSWMLSKFGCDQGALIRLNLLRTVVTL